MTEIDKKEIASEQCCPYLEVCGLIQTHQDNLPGLVDRFKQDYCFHNHLACSRRWIQDFLGAEKVPELMMPQQHEWAEQLLFEANVSYTAFEQKYHMPWHRVES